MAHVLSDLHGTILNIDAPTPHGPPTATIRGNAQESTGYNQSGAFIPGRTISKIHTLYTDHENPSSASSEGGEPPRRVLARIHILQLQPTDRAIEDRFSIRLTDNPKCTSSSESPGRLRLQLGVYDGHRGPWAAQYSCEMIPEKLDDVAFTVARSSGDLTSNPRTSAEDIKSIFEAFDTEVLETFTKDNQPELSIPKVRQQVNRLSTILGLRSPWKRSDTGSRTSVGDHGPSHHGTDASPRNEELAALRAVSGCTASVLLLDWQSPCTISTADISTPRTGTSTMRHDACLINLGDSRVVVAPLDTDIQTAINIWRTIDANSSTPSERERLTREHPSDDPRDIIVGKRLFGETLSTRAFGDAHYKLPYREFDATSREKKTAHPALSREDKALHRHYVRAMSTYLETAAARQAAIQGDTAVAAAAATPKRKVRTLTLEERYDAMFSSYHSPPYISATPDVQIWSERNKESSSTDESGSGGGGGGGGSGAPCRMLAILATDGLWDLAESEEAVRIVRELVNAGGGRSKEEEPVNFAQGLLERIVREKGTKPGDDVTILVVEYDTCGSL